MSSKLLIKILKNFIVDLSHFDVLPKKYLKMFKTTKRFYKLIIFITNSVSLKWFLFIQHSKVQILSDRIPQIKKPVLPGL